MFKFEWPRDSWGYDLLRTVPDDAWALKPRGGPPVYSRPKESDALFRRFAMLDGPEDIQRFANDWGLLWRDPPVETVAGGFPRFPEGMHLIRPHWTAPIMELKGSVGILDRGDKALAAEGFNYPREDLLHGPLCALRIVETGKSHERQIELEPIDLLSELFRQVAVAITEDKQYRRCKVCSNWWSYGPGTGRRASKEFCSDRCRVAWARKLEKGESK